MYKLTKEKYTELITTLQNLWSERAEGLEDNGSCPFCGAFQDESCGVCPAYVELESSCCIPELHEYFSAQGSDIAKTMAAAVYRIAKQLSWDNYCVKLRE